MCGLIALQNKRQERKQQALTTFPFWFYSEKGSVIPGDSFKIGRLKIVL